LKGLIFVGSILSASLLLFLPVNAATLVQPLDQASWTVTQQPFHCAMQQRLNLAGDVRFVLDAGEQLKLEFSSVGRRQNISYAAVRAISNPINNLGEFERQALIEADRLDPSYAQFTRHAWALLDAVEAGSGLGFSISTATGQRSVAVQSLYGKNAVAEFRKCAAQLSPLSWSQARSSQVMFQQGSITTDAVGHKQIEKIVGYLPFDPLVKRILIDGYSHDGSSHLRNRMLAEQRADDVRALFIDLGVDANLIEVRAHGDRYTDATQGSSARKAAESAVQIRLIHEP